MQVVYLNDAVRLAISTVLHVFELTTKRKRKQPEASEEKTLSRNASSETTSTSTVHLPEINLDEVSWHDKQDDCWIVLYDKIYDVTQILHEHPGGADILLEYAGRDATLAFRGFGHSAQAWQMLQNYLIGVLPENEREHIFIQCEMGMNFQVRTLWP